MAELAQLATDTSVDKETDWKRIEGLLRSHWPDLPKILSHQFIGSCDNEIYILELETPVKTSQGEPFHKIVVRIPATEKSERPEQHNPSHQSWVLGQYAEKGVPVPLEIFCSVDHDFLIESCIRGKEMVHLSSHITPNAYIEIGTCLKDMHKVKTKKFGDFGPVPGEGTEDTWLAYLDKLFYRRFTIIKESKLWDEDMCTKIDQVYASKKEYLQNFNDPSLVHGDMNTSNVFLEEKDGHYHVSGIIDFADSISGDPLYDLGGFMLEIHIKTQIEPKFSDLDDLLKGYGALDPTQEEMVKFYSLVLIVYYLVEDLEIRQKRIRLYTAKAKAVLAALTI